MKKKHLTKREIARRDFIEYLTRREFLSSGIRNSASLMAVPLVLRQLFHETSAFAEVAPLGNPSWRVIQIHYAGGPGSLNHPVPLDVNGERLRTSTMGRYGVNPLTVPIVDHFGNSWFNVSNTGNTPQADFIDGILSRVPDAQRNRILAWSVAAKSQDDNGTNPCGLTSIFRATGYSNAPLIDALGFRSTETGLANSNLPLGAKFPPFVPVTVDDIINQRNYALSLASNTQAERDRIGNIARAIQSMSGKHLASDSLKEMSPEKAAILLDTHKKNLDYVNPTIPNLDPRLGDLPGAVTYSGAFGITANSNPADSNFRFAVGLRYLLNDQVNFLGTTFSGRDYHQNASLGAGGTREKDNEHGVLIGNIAALAIAEQKNVLIVTTQDGAVDGPADHTAPIVANGDRGEQAMFTVFAVMGNPSTNLSLSIRQIGGKRQDTGTNLTTTPTGNGDVPAASAIAANILYLNDCPVDKISKVLPIFTDSAAVMKHIAIKKS